MKRIGFIKNCADRVFKQLGSGHTENIYHSAMEVELRSCGIRYESEYILPIKYRDHVIGNSRIDLMVTIGEEDPIPVELKAITSDIRFVEIGQLEAYLRCLGLKRGLLINFPQNGVKRARECIDHCIVDIDNPILSKSEKKEKLKTEELKKEGLDIPLQGLDIPVPERKVSIV